MSNGHDKALDEAQLGNLYDCSLIDKGWGINDGPDLAVDGMRAFFDMVCNVESCVVRFAFIDLNRGMTHGR